MILSLDNKSLSILFPPVLFYEKNKRVEVKDFLLTKTNEHLYLGVH